MKINDIFDFISIPFIYFEKGGFLIFPLFFISVILWSIIIESFFILKQEKRKINIFLDTFEKEKKINYNEYQEINNTLKNFDKNISYIKILTFIAPLIGLLGTITGLLRTFNFTDLDNFNHISSGIAEALITTELGLLIALPAYFFKNYQLNLLSKYKLFFEHIKNNYDYN